MGIKDISNKEKKHKRPYSSLAGKKLEWGNMQQPERKEDENKLIPAEKINLIVN